MYSVDIEIICKSIIYIQVNNIFNKVIYVIINFYLNF